MESAISPGNGVGGTEDRSRNDPAWQLRKYLMLLAVMVATVTYVAGLDPPGGVWQETKDGHRTGNPILPATRRVRYTLFYYFNATAFAASLVVIILLLFMKNFTRLRAVGFVMVVDVLCLMVAYVAGSCRGLLTTVYASLLCAAVFAMVVLPTWLAKPGPAHDDGDKEVVTGLRVKERRKVLMLLAIFVTTVTYTAALNPPGGFWEHAQGSHAGHRAGDPILLERHSARFVVFLFCNTAAFAASVVVITLLLSSRLSVDRRSQAVLYAGIMVALLGLMGSYAAGSSRKTRTTLLVLGLVGLVIGYISVVGAIYYLFTTPLGRRRQAPGRSGTQAAQPNNDPLDKARSLILLLATLTATVTYQAGLDPPGGVGHDNGDGHKGGDLMLPSMHARRHKVFFYCNSAAFVASIVVIIMVQSRRLVSRHALEAAVILELFGLMGAYAAGSCRDARTSIYVLALAAAIFVVGVVHVVIQSRRANEDYSNEQEGDSVKEEEKKRKLLLLLAILAVTVTYQAGLSPPGKFWLEHGDQEHHHLGDSVFADNYPRRYKAFFYCNATSFMASAAIIVFLVNRRLSSAAQKYFWALSGTVLIGLLGAYAAGTTRRVRTSIYVFALVGAVLTFAVLHIRVVHEKLLAKWFSLSREESQPNPAQSTANSAAALSSSEARTPASMAPPPPQPRPDDEARYTEEYRMRKYLMLLGILAASITYQAGLAPPGGAWPADGDGHSAGDLTLHDGDRCRFRAFFYSNSTSFVASIVAIALLVQDIWFVKFDSSWLLLQPMHTALVLDLLGLLVAYASGGSRDWVTSVYVLAVAATVLAYITIYVVLRSVPPRLRRRELSSATLSRAAAAGASGVTG